MARRLTPRRLGRQPRHHRPPLHRQESHRPRNERRDARRYADLKFLRRGAPLDDFSVHLDPDGWWREWTPEREDGVGDTYDQMLLDALHVHGVFRSSKDAGDKAGMSENTAKKHLGILLNLGLVRREIGRSGAHVWHPVDTDQEGL